MSKFLSITVVVLMLGCGGGASDLQKEEAASPPDGVTLTPHDERVEVAVDGRPFTAFHYEEKWDKPFLYPLTTASGTVISRGYPIEPRAGETADHAWHRGIWYGHGDINGQDFWREKGREVTSILVPQAKPAVSGDALSVELAMQTPTDGTIGSIEKSFTFSGARNLRVIDATIRIRADEGVALRFGDTDDGGFGIRLSDAFREDNGGVTANAEGLETSENIWGKASRWTNYSAEVGGKAVGVAIFDHPSNLRYPTTWHARGYSLNAANPFATRSFTGDPSADGSHTIPEGESLTFRYRVVIHEGFPGEVNVEELYRDYVQ
ncbi:MAG: PmoA family protein [Acidobacteria bacterium]|nr:PmoA family protein [Acidobacteriota bacterium]MDA1235606.1 PmoA family protein [Acidobacteriota bacterium]